MRSNSEQGRSAALNCGFRLASGDIVVTTDDDVRVAPDWLTTIARGLETLNCDYVGGRVLPIWGSQPPNWVPRVNGRLWAVIALLDYGAEPIAFGRRVPLGVNMAMRRAAIDRAGGFDTRIGRKAGTLLGQEVREWCMRAHACGLTGCYVPDMVVQHLIPTERLNKAYFRRWFFWRGISRAMLYAQSGKDMEAPEQTTLDFSQIKHIAGVPRYMFRSALVAAKDSLAARLRGDAVNAFEHELFVWMFAGILKQRWKDRHLSAPATHGEPHRLVLQVTSGLRVFEARATGQRTVKVATTGSWSDAAMPTSAVVLTTSAELSDSVGPGAKNT